MAWIPGGAFQMGADNKAQPDEYPKHTVTVAGFWIDKTEVTNAQFAAFVKATGYITTAEKTPDWDQLKKQLPPGAAKPDENLLVAASLVFIPPDHPISLDDYSQWWAWKKGASWKHPQGPGSDLNGKANYPVVHISWYDAAAYCKWAGKTLPTEADHYYHTAPVASFDPNGYGLYDMAGNVWEWCADYYNNTYYDQSNNSTSPRGPLKSYDPDEPFATKRVIRGGSFLCNDSYCSGYRVSRRMKSTEDSGLEHLGFRCVTHR
jgi:formylglycine-generating enzyme required for sulfatase activity